MTPQRPMAETTPKLLVSVRNHHEVAAALHGGADWIDLKEPNSGTLGAVDFETAQQAAKTLEDSRPLSAALGELVDWSVSPARRLLDISEIQVVKLGLAGCATQPDWPDRWKAIATSILASGKQLAAVVYADWQRAAAPAPAEVVSRAADCGCDYLLVDTLDKQNGSVLDLLGEATLKRLLSAAHRQRMQTVVAGGLTEESLTRLPSSEIDVIAVRGGVCPGDRTGVVSEDLVRRFATAISVRWKKSTPVESPS